MAFICSPTPLQQKNRGPYNLDIAFRRHSARRKKITKKQQNKNFFPATNQQSPTTNKLSTLNQQVYVKHSRLKNQFDVFQIV